MSIGFSICRGFGEPLAQPPTPSFLPRSTGGTYDARSPWRWLGQVLSFVCLHTRTFVHCIITKGQHLLTVFSLKVIVVVYLIDFIVHLGGNLPLASQKSIHHMFYADTVDLFLIFYIWNGKPITLPMLSLSLFVIGDSV